MFSIYEYDDYNDDGTSKMTDAQLKQLREKFSKESAKIIKSLEACIKEAEKHGVGIWVSIGGVSNQYDQQDGWLSSSC